MNRLAILIDGNNFYKGCQLNFNRPDVDFRKLGIKLAKALDGELLRIYYYNAHVSKTIDPLGYQRQQKFFDNLRATPFITLKLGHLVYHRIRNEHGVSSQYFPTEKGIDVQIAVDMIRLGLLNACEGTILVSGDSDYIYAVRFAKDLGSKLYIASFPQGGSTELRNEGDGFILLDYPFIQDCFIRPAPISRHEPVITMQQRPIRPYIPHEHVGQPDDFQHFDPDEGFDLNKFGTEPVKPVEQAGQEDTNKEQPDDEDVDATSESEDDKPSE